MSERDGIGKIERLPWELREQVCRRLRDNTRALEICAWLNALPEVQTMLDTYFGEQPITPQNLSNFRANGYQKWLARQTKLDRTRELAHFSLDIAKASGGNLADGAAQVLSGNILELLETLEELKAAPEDETPEARNIRLEVAASALDSLTMAVHRLRKGDQNAEALRQREKQLEQAEQSLLLEEKKYQRTTCELFLKWRNDRRATEIADGPGPDKEKVDQLGQHIFGDLWK